MSKAFVVYHTPRTGAGYFLAPEGAEVVGVFDPREARQFKTEAAAAKVAEEYGAVGSIGHVLRLAGDYA
ncbi:TPA: hypothetical protein L4T04_005247 [Pseudomonas aeruginosa]|nr:hypothetical protein [Pseudomonas aeruginosa]